MRIKPFYLLNEKELHMTLSWRNNINVRKWMINQNPISLIEHKKFSKNLRNDNYRKYWLVYNESDPIGVIYYILNDSGIPELGLYKNIEIKDQVGEILIDLIEEEIKKNEKFIVELIVRSDNSKAISLYEKKNYICISDENMIRRYRKKI